MRVPIKYIASSGREYSLMSNGVRQKNANYHKWEWGVEGTKLQYGVRVAGFSRDAGNYETELYISGGPVARQKFIDDLHDDFENDVRKNKTGRFVWGSYHADGFITSSDTHPAENNIETVNKITIFCPYPFWIEELTVSMFPSQASASNFLDFPFDFPFDFTPPTIGQKIVKSDFPFESEFQMIIYGFVDNPRITVNGYSYVLYTTIPQGAYVIIDSRAKTIMQYNINGTRTNIFNYRNKTDSVFQRIPSGNLNITWDASFGVDLTIFHERSEPRAEVVT